MHGSLSLGTLELPRFPQLQDVNDIMRLINVWILVTALLVSVPDVPKRFNSSRLTSNLVSISVVRPLINLESSFHGGIGR